MVRTGGEDKVLVIGTEHLSVTTRPDDRGTRMIFGDGAGAMVVGLADEPGNRPGGVGIERSQSDAIKQDRDWMQFFQDREKDINTERPWIAMTGIAVFRWAAFEMAKVARQAIERSGLTPADLDVSSPIRRTRGSPTSSRAASNSATTFRWPTTSRRRETPPPLPFRWRSKRFCAPARPRRATPLCSSASARVCPTPVRWSLPAPPKV